MRVVAWLQLLETSPKRRSERLLAWSWRSMISSPRLTISKQTDPDYRCTETATMGGWGVFADQDGNS